MAASDRVHERAQLLVPSTGMFSGREIGRAAVDGVVGGVACGHARSIRTLNIPAWRPSISSSSSSISMASAMLRVRTTSAALSARSTPTLLICVKVGRRSTERRGPEPLTDRCLRHMPRQHLHPLEVVAGADGRDDRAQVARDGRVEQRYLRGGRIGR